MTFYSRRIAFWRDQMQGATSEIREGRRRCPLYLAHVLRLKAYATRRAAVKWIAYQYGWRRWLPANWYALARCETAVRWDWDSGRYVSAFGIYRPAYADDAHRIGALSWDETIGRFGRVPTPRAQYDAALSHYAANGDGWGCPGP